MGLWLLADFQAACFESSASLGTWRATLSIKPKCGVRRDPGGVNGVIRIPALEYRQGYCGWRGALNKSLEKKFEVKESISGEKTSNEGKQIDSGWVS